MREGETIEGSRTMCGIDPIQCSSAQVRGKLRSARAMPESAAESALWMTGRRTHASIHSHSTQNTADLESDKPNEHTSEGEGETIEGSRTMRN